MDADLEDLLEELQRPVRTSLTKELRSWTLDTFHESLSLDSMGFLGITDVVGMIIRSFEGRWIRASETRMGNVAVRRLTCIAVFKAWAGREVWDYDVKRVELGFDRTHALILLRTGRYLDVILVKSKHNTCNGTTGPTYAEKVREVADELAADPDNADLTVRTGLLAITGGHNRGFVLGKWGFDWYAEGQAAYTILTGESTFYRDYILYVLDMGVETKLEENKRDRVAVLINQFLEEKCKWKPGKMPRYKRSVVRHPITEEFEVNIDDLITSTLANRDHAEDLKALILEGLVPAGTPAETINLSVSFKRKPLHPEEELFDEMFGTRGSTRGDSA